MQQRIYAHNVLAWLDCATAGFNKKTETSLDLYLWDVSLRNERPSTQNILLHVDKKCAFSSQFVARRIYSWNGASAKYGKQNVVTGLYSLDRFRKERERGAARNTAYESAVVTGT